MLIDIEAIIKEVVYNYVQEALCKALTLKYILEKELTSHLHFEPCVVLHPRYLNPVNCGSLNRLPQLHIMVG